MPAPARKNLKPEDRRNQLLDCAQALFSTNGYEATTINDVMMMAGVSKGGFYHHFQSKEALLEALACRMAREARDGVQPILDDPSLDAFARLNTMLRHLRVQKTEYTPELIRAFETLFDPANVVLYDRIRRAIGEVMLPAITETIAQGIEEKTFDVADAESSARILLDINAGVQNLMAAAFAERDAGIHDGPARKRLEAMIAAQGIAIDRLLGLPDGSIDWIDSQSLAALMRWEE